MDFDLALHRTVTVEGWFFILGKLGHWLVAVKDDCLAAMF
jgi:hypothetical protein